jgi:hypothetical protein
MESVVKPRIVYCDAPNSISLVEYEQDEYTMEVLAKFRYWAAL